MADVRHYGFEVEDADNESISNFDEDNAFDGDAFGGAWSDDGADFGLSNTSATQKIERIGYSGDATVLSYANPYAKWGQEKLRRLFQKHSYEPLVHPENGTTIRLLHLLPRAILIDYGASFGVPRLRRHDVLKVSSSIQFIEQSRMSMQRCRTPGPAGGIPSTSMLCQAREREAVCRHI